MAMYGLAGIVIWWLGWIAAYKCNSLYKLVLEYVAEGVWMPTLISVTGIFD